MTMAFWKNLLTTARFSGVLNPRLVAFRIFDSPVSMVNATSRTELVRVFSGSVVRNCFITPGNGLVDHPPKRVQLGQMDGRLHLEFTCKTCGTRNAKSISKLAYEKGIVIVTCDGCKNNHLIADNLNWYPELQGVKNIEGFMLAQGEIVKRTVGESTGNDTGSVMTGNSSEMESTKDPNKQ